MPHEAALDGTRQVVGALFASTVTTIAVFVPVLFLDDVEGQLFADLALTIAIAVGDLDAGRGDRAAGRRGRLAQGEEADRRDRTARGTRVTRWIMRATRTRRARPRGSAALVLGPSLLTLALLCRRSTTCRRSSARRSTRSSTSRRA